jgi:hypothetical protein
MSKKSARLQTEWAPNPRRKRRVRPYVRKAADRMMIAICIGLPLAVLFLQYFKHLMK